MIRALERIRGKLESRKAQGSWRLDDGEWVTIKGTHVEIDDETGAITKGPERLRAISNPDRGKTSIAKRVVARTKAAMKEHAEKLSGLAKKQKNWEYEKRYAENGVQTCKEMAEQYKRDVDQRTQRLQQQFPEGKAAIEEELKGLSDRLDILNKQLYPDDPSQRLRGEERKAVADEYDAILGARGPLYDALADFRGLERAQNRYNQWNDALKQKEQALQDVMDRDPSKEYESAHQEYDRLAAKRNEAVLRMFPTAEACQTSDDVDDFLRAKEIFRKDGEHHYDADKKVNLVSMDIKHSKVIADRLDQFMTDYPKLKGEFGGIDCHDMSNERGCENAYAYCRSHTTREVCFNEKEFGHGVESKYSKEKDAVSGWHPPGTNTASIIDHEYTHAIEKVLRERLGTRSKISDIVMKRAMKAVDGKYDKEREHEVRASVSQYANDNKGYFWDKRTGKYRENKEYGRNTEFLAEAMEEARSSPNPRPYAVAVRKEMEKLMKEAGLL